MPRIICGECHEEVRCLKTGEQVEFEGWIWSGDRLSCRNCDGGSFIVLAKEPIMRPWEAENVKYKGVRV